jgi:3-oxoacyl-[acyl-carrier protein] reductase
MMDLGGQVALVTGASRGIGRSIALALGGRGATVVGTATTDAGAQSITAYLSQAQVRGNGAQLDVRIATNVERLVAEIERAHGAVSILVNNAGIARDNLAMRMKEDEWDAVIDTNLKSVFRLCKAVMRGMMKARSGRVINITSVVGSSGNAGQINYAAAKAGIAGLTRSLAREIGSRGITVNCVAPGFIDTDMTRVLTDAQRETLLRQIPLGRLGNPEDVAAVVAFLASPQAAYITGATLHVNGGMYMS